MSRCIVPKDCREIGQDFVLRKIFRMSGLLILKNCYLKIFFTFLMFCKNVKTNNTSNQGLHILDTECTQFIQESSLSNMELALVLLQSLGLEMEER
jgi:hypothetical protein